MAKKTTLIPSRREAPYRGRASGGGASFDTRLRRYSG